MSTTVQTAAETVAAIVPDRTITYPLRNGSFLAHRCPDFCTADHESDLDGMLMPADLYHEGDAISLDFDTIEGSRQPVLVARIRQYPFAHDGSEVPHMELVPEGDSGESTGCLSPVDFQAEIGRVQRHLAKLLHLNEQLAQARAEAHAEWMAAPGPNGRSRAPWLSIDDDDVKTMPVDYLVRVFGVTVVEVDDDSRRADHLAIVSGPFGDMTVSFLRSVPQVVREELLREELLKLRGAL
ncbi:hypothetical protein [Streptomyces sp. NPDC052225]|uniref:DUF6907 domain-containing protein n=1 Tax=Streptomyces sp. NPDC052225 TaxID=3154949 RepID=UPI0034138033